VLLFSFTCVTPFIVRNIIQHAFYIGVAPMGLNKKTYVILAATNVPPLRGYIFSYPRSFSSQRRMPRSIARFFFIIQCSNSFIPFAERHTKFFNASEYGNSLEKWALKIEH